MLADKKHAYSRLYAALLAACVLAWLASPALAGDDEDDPYIKAMIEKRKREKAIREGRDPDAPEEVKEEPAKAPDDMSGLISTLKQQWASDKAESDLARDAVNKLKDLRDKDSNSRSRLIKQLAGYKEQQALKLVAEAMRTAGVARDKLRAVLTKHRPLALKAIADPKYTEKDGCTLQPKVDEACQPLFDVWRDPVGYSITNFKLDLSAPAVRLDTLARLLGEVDTELAPWEGGAKDAEGALRSLGAELMDIKLEELAANKSTLAANDAVKEADADANCREHVRILNDYRMMLGKKALKIEPTLTKAAMSHAKYLEKLGYIAHDIKGHPDGETPTARGKNAGYSGTVGENCLQGSETPDAAVWQWYRAAEHHRSMIADWTSIGVGYSGKIWVQNFGGGGKGR